jgi:hypothetical protein
LLWQKYVEEQRVQLVAADGRTLQLQQRLEELQRDVQQHKSAAKMALNELVDKLDIRKGSGVDQPTQHASSGAYDGDPH